MRNIRERASVIITKYIRYIEEHNILLINQDYKKIENIHQPNFKCTYIIANNLLVYNYKHLGFAN